MKKHSLTLSQKRTVNGYLFILPWLVGFVVFYVRSLFMTVQFSLSELTYIPQNTNYCVTIPFIAYGTNGYSVRGTVLISVTLSAVSEVYTPMLRGSSVVMPASYISSAVTSATITTTNVCSLATRAPGAATTTGITLNRSAAGKTPAVSLIVHRCSATRHCRATSRRTAA